MNQYTLDYSDPQSQRWPGTPPPYRRTNRVVWGALLVFSGWAGGMVCMSLLQLRAEAKWQHQLYQRQTVRYDSLLSAKVETDRQLNQLRLQVQRQP